MQEGLLHPLPPLEDGDIFITPCVHTFGWRHGHAGIVVDGKSEQILEATSPGTRSSIRSAEHWRSYPAFFILRLRDADSVTRRAIGRYAAEHLAEVPYSLTFGLLSREPDAPLRRCHCINLVWYAYRQFGYELDPDGGFLVTIEDLLQCPLLEVVYHAHLPPDC